MNKTRLQTVAHAIKNRDPHRDPEFNFGRYAVRKDDRSGPDVSLDAVLLKPSDYAIDIAAWTCYCYPDLTGEIAWPLDYWSSARDILGLAEARADLLFVGMDERGKIVNANLSADEAVVSLLALAAVAA